MNKQPIFLIIDLFCGAGGTTTGFSMAKVEDVEVAKVIACVNHDPKAIQSHWQNHPDVRHFEEDIRTLDLTGLVATANWWKDKYPDAYLVLWASLECTNFSKAKGGLPRDADSRTLADHLHRYVEALQPDYVQIENVVEFMSWGPLDANGKPISRKNGSEYLRWKNEMDAHGYYNEWTELNSANFGAYTSRNRLFGCFARPGLPIIWPQPTHAKKPVQESMFNGQLKKWKAVKEVLDFTDEGESIFTRSKELSDKTLERIYAGLIKYVAKGDKAFISKYFSGRPAGKNISVDGPAGTIMTVNQQALVQPICMLKYNSTDKNGVHTPPSIENPCPTVAAQSRLGLVQGKFLAAYYGNGDNCSSVESPCPTIPTKDRFQYVNPEFFIDKHYGTSAQNQSIDQPAGTVMPNDKHRLVSIEPVPTEVIVNCNCGNSFKSTEIAYEKQPCPACGGYEGSVTFAPFIMPTNFDNGPKSVEEPAPVITASRKHHYLINPAWGGNPGSIEEPCCVVVARQDKAPLYFVQVETGSVKIAVYDTDSEVMIRIKQFMAVFGLVDIKMRMLRVLELLMIQGFPANYHLYGNQADQKRFIGNSVVPHVVKAWCEAMAVEIIRKLKIKVA